MNRKGIITKIIGNMVSVRVDGSVTQNEVAYILHGSEHLNAEVIRIRGKIAETQLYEATTALRIGDEVEFT